MHLIVITYVVMAQQIGSIFVAHFNPLIEQATMQGNSLSVPWDRPHVIAAMVISDVRPALVSKPARTPHPPTATVQAVGYS